MAFVSAIEFLRNPNLFANLRGSGTCSSCDVPIQESITGCRKVVGTGYMCSDCYFDEMGRLVEEFPVSTPRTHRG